MRCFAFTLYHNGEGQDEATEEISAQIDTINNFLFDLGNDAYAEFCDINGDGTAPSQIIIYDAVDSIEAEDIVTYALGGVVWSNLRQIFY